MDISELKKQNEELKSLILWSARRMSYKDYKDYIYNEYEKIVNEKPERL